MAYQQPPSGYANYPRPNIKGAPVPPGPPAINFSSIGEAWNLVREDLGIWVLMWFIALVIIFAISLPIGFALNMAFYGSIMGPATPVFDATYVAQQVASSIISGGLSYVVYGGIYAAHLKRLRGQQFAVDDMFIGFKHFIPLFGAGMIIVTLMFAGLLLLVVPGIYVTGASVFAPAIIVDQNVGAIEGVRRSFQALGKHAFPMFALLVLGVVLLIAGLLACCIGYLFAAPVFSFMIAIHYHAFFPPANHYDVSLIPPSPA